MKIKIIITAMLMSVVAKAATDSIKTACPIVKIEMERLPDLNIPRSGHEVFYVNGELTVAGGHTDGFVPTPTAEYFKDGEWHTIPKIFHKMRYFTSFLHIRTRYFTSFVFLQYDILQVLSMNTR